MEYIKKYFNVLCTIILGFHFVSMNGSELGYISFSSSDIRQTTSSIPAIISENPAIAAVGISAAAILCGGLYLGKDKISGWAQRKCENAQKEIKDECFTQLKCVENSSLKNKALLYALKPFAMGAKDYWEYNRVHLGIIAVLTGMGWLTGHSYSAGGCSVGVFAKGWWDQALAAVQKTLEDIKQEMAIMKEENLKLHNKTHEEVRDLSGKVETVLTELATTKKEITSQMSGMEDRVSSDIKSVGEDVIKLSAKVDEVPKKIMELAVELSVAQSALVGIKGTNEEIVAQNNAINANVGALSIKLSRVCDDYAAATESLNTCKETFLTEVKNLSNTHQEQMEEINTKVNGQNDQLEDLKLNIDDKFKIVFEKITDQVQVFKLFQQEQESQGTQMIELSKQAAGLLKKAQKSRQCNNNILSIVDKLQKSEESRAIKYAEIVTSLKEMNRVNQETVNTFCSNMQLLEKKMNARIDELEKKVDNNENSRQQDNTKILARVDYNGTNIESLKRMLQVQADQMDLIQRQNVLLLQEVENFKKAMAELRAQVQGLHKKSDTTISIVQETHDIIKQCPINQPTYPALLPVMQDDSEVSGSSMPYYTSFQQVWSDPLVKRDKIFPVEPKGSFSADMFVAMARRQTRAIESTNKK